jgi:predicted DsbA family dithiol-disulfide isomerase
MIFDERHLVTGAQDAENFVSVVRQLTAFRAA